MQDPVAATPRTGPFGEVASFYAALGSAGREAAARWRVAVVVEVVMIVAWFAIRTVADTDSRTYAIWVIAAGVLALVAPLSGLVVFIATSAFFEPDSLARTLASRELILLPLALGVILRVLVDRSRWRPGPAIWLALALALGTALGVAHSFARFDQDIAYHAAQSWLGNMLGPVILLVAAAWTARQGNLRALLTATVVGVLVAVVGLTEYFAPGTISEGRLDWVGFWKDFGARLAGTVPSPNALSAQLIVPTMLLLAAALFARDVRLRLVATVASIPLIAAHYLTFSRSPILALYVFVVVAAWRIRRTVGILILAGGLVGAILFLPTYLQFRSQSAPEGAVTPGSLLVASDVHRFRAWGAASSMWADAPLTGQGYLAYKELADAYGDPVLGSPHNEWLRLFAEEGTIVGLVGLFFIVVTARSLARIPAWLGTGLLAGFAGYVVAAMFNNPLLFIRVSAVAFATFGVGLALAERARAPANVGTIESSGDPTLH